MMQDLRIGRIYANCIGLPFCLFVDLTVAICKKVNYALSSTCYRVRNSLQFGLRIDVGDVAESVQHYGTALRVGNIARVIR